MCLCACALLLVLRIDAFEMYAVMQLQSWRKGVCRECAMCNQNANDPCMHDHIIQAAVKIRKVHDIIVFAIVETDRIAGSLPVTFKINMRTTVRSAVAYHSVM